MKKSKIVNSEQPELDRLTRNLSIYNSLKNSIDHVKKQFDQSNLDLSFNSRVELKIRETQQAIGETYAKNIQRIETITIEREKLTIYGLEFKIGDRVRLTLDEMNYFNDTSGIKKHGRVSGFGTVVFRCIGHVENSPSNSEPNAEIDLFICFSSGQTLRVASCNVEKLKKKIKKQKPIPENFNLRLINENGVGA